MPGWVKSVQVSTGTLSGLTATIALTKGQVPGNCFCRLTTNFPGMSGDNVDYLCVSADVQSGPDQVELERRVSTGDIIYVLTIIEVDPRQARVQQVAFTLGGTDDTQAITAVDLDYAFITGYARETVSGSVDDYDQCSFELDFTSTTVVNAARQVSDGTWEVIAWVVEAVGATKAFTVQTLSGSETGNSKNVFPSSVVMADTMSFFSYQTTVINAAAAASVTGELTSSTTYALARSSSAAEFDFTVFIVESAGGISVQRPVFSLASSTEPEDITITEVDLTRTIAHSPNGPSGPSSPTGRSSIGGQNGTEAVCATFTFQDSTTLRGENGTVDTGFSNHPIEVVEFILTGPLPPIEPWVKSIQVSTGTLSGATATVSMTKGQIPANCFCRLTTNISGVGTDLAADLCVSATVSAGPDQVDLARRLTTGSIDYVLTIIEVDPAEASVEQVIFTVSGASDTETINTVVLKHAFITGYARETASAGDDYGESCLELTFNSITEVQATRNSSQTTGTFEIVAWVVSAINTGIESFTVQTVDVDSQSGTTANATIPSAVVLADTLTLFSYQIASGVDDSDSGAITGELTGTTNYRFQRAAGTEPFYATAFVVEMHDASSVQRVVFALNNASDPESITITSVDLTRSMAHSPNGPSGPSSVTGRVNLTGNSGQPAVNATFEITGATTVRGENGTASTIVATHTAEIVEFELAGAAGIESYMFVA